VKIAKSGIRENRGSMLVMAAVLSFVTILLGVTFLTFAITLHNNISYEIASKQSLYDTHAAMMLGLADKIAGRNSHGVWQRLYDNNWMRYSYSAEGGQDIDIGVLN
jgi:hypothetical protein